MILKFRRATIINVAIITEFLKVADFLLKAAAIDEKCEIDKRLFWKTSNVVCLLSYSNKYQIISGLQSLHHDTWNTAKFFAQIKDRSFFFLPFIVFDKQRSGLDSYNWGAFKCIYFLCFIIFLINFLFTIHFLNLLLLWRVSSRLVPSEC